VPKLKKKIKTPMPKMTLAEIAQYLEQNRKTIGDFSLFWIDSDDGLYVVGSTNQEQTCRISIAAQINAQKAMLGTL